MKNTTLFLTAALVMVNCAAGLCAEGAKPGQNKQGLEKKEPVVTSNLKEIQGEVSSLSKRSISVVYGRDEAKAEEYEMLLPFDPKDIKLEHKQSLSEISPGDVVLVQYTEDTSDYGSRQETKIKARTIRFLNPADAQSKYKPTPAVHEKAPDIEGLSLKGVKSDE
jgi:hypothetical protein